MNRSTGQYLDAAGVQNALNRVLRPLVRLAIKCGVTRATMTGLLDGLERERLLKREADRNDRRMLLIQLTSKGRKMLDGMLPDYYHRIALLMNQLSNAEKHQLVDLLGKVNGGIGAVLSPNGSPA